MEGGCVEKQGKIGSVVFGWNHQSPELVQARVLGEMLCNKSLSNNDQPLASICQVCDPPARVGK